MSQPFLHPAKTRHTVLRPPCPGFQPSLSPCCLPTLGPGGPEPNSGEPQACVAGEVMSVSQAKQFWLPSPRKLMTWGIANWPPLADGEGSTDPPWETVPHQSGLSFSIFTPKVLSGHLVVQNLRSCLTSMGSMVRVPWNSPRRDWRREQGWVMERVQALPPDFCPGLLIWSQPQPPILPQVPACLKHKPSLGVPLPKAPHMVPGPSGWRRLFPMTRQPRHSLTLTTSSATPLVMSLQTSPRKHTLCSSALEMPTQLLRQSRLTFLWSLSPFLALSSLLSTFLPPPWLTSVSFTFPLIGYKDTQLTLNLR